MCMCIYLYIYIINQAFPAKNTKQPFLKHHIQHLSRKEHLAIKVQKKAIQILSEIHPALPNHPEPLWSVAAYHWIKWRGGGDAKMAHRLDPAKTL